MTALTRVLVEVAVAVSPEGHRSVRREQWLADVRDAEAVDMSPTALAFGALMTALFHRRTIHRRSWGETMTAAPIHVRPAPHTVRTVPLLVVTAFASFLVSIPLFALLGRYSGVPGSSVLVWAVVLGMTVVPAVLLMTAALLVDGVGLRRRALSALAIAALTTVWWGALTGAIPTPGPSWLGGSVVAVALLTVWFVLRSHRGWIWSLLALPIVVGGLVGPLADAVISTDVSAGLGTMISWLARLAPFVAVAVATVIASRAVPSDRRELPAPAPAPAPVD